MTQSSQCFKSVQRYFDSLLSLSYARILPLYIFGILRKYMGKVSSCSERSSVDTCNLTSRNLQQYSPVLFMCSLSEGRGVEVQPLDAQVETVRPRIAPCGVKIQSATLAVLEINLGN